MEGLYLFLLEKLDNIIKENNVKSICDYGCGAGELLLELKKLNPALKQAVGVDYFEKFESRERPDSKPEYKKAGIEFIDKDSADFSRLSEKPEGFDLVFSTFSLHHWELPVTELQTIYGMLNYQGMIVTMDFAFTNDNPAQISKNFSSFVDLQLRAFNRTYHRHHYTPEQAMDLFRALDVKDIICEILKFSDTPEKKAENLAQYKSRNQKLSEQMQTEPASMIKPAENRPDLEMVYKKIFNELYRIERELLDEQGLDFDDLLIIRAVKNLATGLNKQA